MRYKKPRGYDFVIPFYRIQALAHFGDYASACSMIPLVHYTDAVTSVPNTFESYLILT